MSDKLQEYLDLIASEKSGEVVRDAIRHAVIVVDSDNGMLDDRNRLSVYEEVTDDMLDAIWGDIISYFPSAVRPTYEEYIDPERAIVMADELKESLFNLISSVTGSDIRSNMYAALNSIIENVANHDATSYYYAIRVIDIFNAFIDACLDDEKKQIAKSKSETWYATLIRNNTGRTDLVTLYNVSTGALARPIVYSILTTLDNSNTRRRDHISSSLVEGNGKWLLAGYIANDFEELAKDLVGSVYIYGSYLIAASQLYIDDRQAAEAQKAYVESIDTEDTFSLYVNVQPEELNPEIYHTYYTVIVSGEQNKYWTFPKAFNFCYERNNNYPLLTFYPIRR